jgi:hypothetical protein
MCLEHCLGALVASRRFYESECLQVALIIRPGFRHHGGFELLKYMVGQWTSEEGQRLIGTIPIGQQAYPFASQLRRTFRCI